MKSIASEPPSRAKVYRVIKISQFGSYKQFSRYPLQTRRIGRFLGSHISEVYMRTTQLQQTCFETLRPRHLWQSYYQLVDRYEHPVHKDLDTNVQWYLTPRALKTQGTKAAKGYTKMRFCKDQRRETRTSEKNPTFSGLYFFHWTFTPRKFNIAPEKWWLKDYSPIGKVTFQGLC